MANQRKAWHRRDGVFELQLKYSSDIRAMLFRHEMENDTLSKDSNYAVFHLLFDSVRGMNRLTSNRDREMRGLIKSQDCKVQELMNKHGLELDDFLRTQITGGQETGDGAEESREHRAWAGKLLRAHSDEKNQLLNEFIGDADKQMKEHHEDEVHSLKSRVAAINLLLGSHGARVDALLREHGREMETLLREYSTEVDRLMSGE